MSEKIIVRMFAALGSIIALLALITTPASAYAAARPTRQAQPGARFDLPVVGAATR
jgi:hypothetical protein